MESKEKLALSNNSKVNLSRVIIVAFAVILVVGVLGMGGSARAADYYVDYETGDDSNNGLTTSTPWKHCSGDSAATGNADITLSAGDIVIFKGGVVYTGTDSGTLITIENSGISGDYITYRGNTESGDWGVGEAIIDGGGTYYKLFSASGKDYIKLINLDITNSENALGVTIANQGMIRIASGCDYWLIQDCIIHSPENYDWRCPIGADGAPYDQRGIFFYGSDGSQNSNIEINNLHTYALAYPIRIFKSNNINIHDSEFSGAATERGTCQGAAEDECGYMSMPLLISNTNSYINIYDNVFRDGWYYQGDDNPTKRCHSGDWIHIYGNSNDIVIERNKFYNDRQFVYSHGTAISFIEDTNGLCQRITFRNNLFLNPFAGNGVVKIGQGDYIYFYSNTWVIYDHTSSTTQGLRITSGAGDNIEIKNNIFINEEEGSTGCSVAILDSSWGGELDGNLYYKPAGDRPIRFGEVSDRYTAAELNSAYPQFEVNGIDGNPNVEDYGSAATCGYANLHLTSSSSLAIDGGIDLNSTGFNDDFDRISRPQGSAWDIGAYEYIDSGPDTTPPTRSNPSPSGTLSAGTTNTTISLTTNESATCKYSTNPNTAYDSMTETFTTTGSTSHSTTVNGLSNGNTYTYYVRAEDTAGNANTDDYVISFSVATQGSGDSGDDGGGESSGGGCFIGTAAVGE